MKQLLTVFALATFFIAPAGAFADGMTSEPIVVPVETQAAPAAKSEPSLGAKFADAILVRIPMVPISLASTGVYLGTTPLTFLMNVDQEAGDTLVSAPWKFTSGRDLGRF